MDGRIIARKVNEGQTLAAQFQTPELFVVAPDMKSEIHIIAAVDEADIGLVSEAQRRELPVRFTVDAWRDDLFKGTIHQVRWDSSIEQNVVTYPVVVSAPNLELKLLPGMTASLSFEVDKAADAIRIPNSALRFYPQREHVRGADRHLLDGDDEPAPADPSAEAFGARRRTRPSSAAAATAATYGSSRVNRSRPSKSPPASATAATRSWSPAS